MAGETTHTKKATGKAMTLGELPAFIDEADRLGAADTSTISGRTGWTGLREVTIKVTRFGDVGKD